MLLNSLGLNFTLFQASLEVTPMGIRGWGSLLSPLVTNRSSVAPDDRKRRREGGPSTDEEDLWVRFPVAAGSSHTKDV